MKALSVIWKVPDDRLRGFSDDTNGLIVVRDLCEHLGRKIDSYLLLGKEYLPEMKLGNIHIVDSQSTAKEYSERSHLEIMKKAFEKALTDIRPDIVHIHDTGDFCRMCMNTCVENQIPYVFTAHSFIGKEQKISRIEDRDIIWQKEIYTVPDIPVVAVGKGLIPKMLKDFPNLKPEQLSVIQNGTDFKAETIVSDLKTRLGFEGRKVLICPGKITYRKNQIQIVRAFQLLSKSIREKTGVIFCGNDRLNGTLQQSIEEAGLGENLKYVGVLNSLQMRDYYSISSGLIMSSISEGLSIAALEAMAYGLPSIMFSDLECAMDLDDERVVCLAEERTDAALAAAIEKWAKKDWDRKAILTYAERFSMERVADEYIACYHRILGTA